MIKVRNNNLCVANYIKICDKVKGLKCIYSIDNLLFIFSFLKNKGVLNINQIIKMKVIKSILVIAFFNTFINLNAQIEVTLPISDIKTINDIYKLEINNTSGNPYAAYLVLELRRDNRIIYEATTNQYNILQPLSMLNESLLQPVQVTRNEVDRLSGNLQLDVKLIDAATRQVLFANRIPVQGVALATDNTGSLNKSLDIRFSGTANLYGQFSSQQGVGSMVPQNYLRAEIHPDASIKGIPIGLDILFSTEQNAFRQSMNQVALRFDAQSFKQQMQQKLTAKVKTLEAIGDPTQLASLKALKDEAVSKKFPQLQEWQNQLNDPDIQQGLKQLKQQQAVEEILKNPEITSNISRRVELEAKKSISEEEKQELEQLTAYLTEIDKLKSKAEQLNGLTKKYQQYQDLNNKISKARKYADKDLIKDPDFVKNGLKSLNVLSKGQELLNGFEAITIGTSYPYYSRLSLSSIAVNGINVEWNPGKIYLAATYGKSARQTLNTDFTIPQLTLPQTTLATKIGYGSPNSNHLHITFIDIEDQFSEASLGSVTKAQDNRIIGTSGQISFLRDKVKIGGEYMASLLTRDKTIATVENQEFARSAIPLNSLMGNINNSSSFGAAWRVFTDMRVLGNATKVKAFVERIDANYYSLGSPTLINDMLRWKAEVRQGFLKNQIYISAYARQDANNLNPLLTSSQSTTKSYGLTGAVMIQKYPTLTFSYAPYAQNNDIIATEQNYATNATMTNVSLGYPWSISKDLITNTSITFLSQDLKSNIPGIDYNLKMYGLSETITYKSATLNIAANYTPNQVIDSQNKQVVTISTTGTATLLKKWRNTIGIQYLSIKDQESKTGFILNSSYPVTSFADIELRCQRNIYSAIQDINDFREWVAWTGVRIRW